VAIRVQHLSVVHLFGTLVLIIACLYWAKAVVIPIVLAVLLTFLLNPVVSALHSRGLPRTPAVLVVVVLLFSLVGGVSWTVARQLTMLAYEIPRYQENLKQKINDLREVGKNGVIERVLTTIKEITAEFQKDSQPLSEPQPGGKLNAAPN
jgi:predicted PurR-regulated permease PerM